MPSKSQQQFKYIQHLRGKYKSKDSAPDTHKWVFESDWTKNVGFKDLPKTVDSNMDKSAKETPKTYYHGSPNANINYLNKGSYITPYKELAEIMGRYHLGTNKTWDDSDLQEPYMFKGEPKFKKGKEPKGKPQVYSLSMIDSLVNKLGNPYEHTIEEETPLTKEATTQENSSLQTYGALMGSYLPSVGYQNLINRNLFDTHDSYLKQGAPGWEEGIKDMVNQTGSKMDLPDSFPKTNGTFTPNNPQSPFFRTERPTIPTTSGRLRSVDGPLQGAIHSSFMDPDVIAHEAGHALQFRNNSNLFQGIRGSALHLGNHAGIASMAFPLLAGLTGDNETLDTTAAAGITAANVPKLWNEFDASRKGLQFLKPFSSFERPGLLGHLRSFKGFPTYLLNAAIPALAVGAKHLTNAYSSDRQ